MPETLPSSSANAIKLENITLHFWESNKGKKDVLLSKYNNRVVIANKELNMKTYTSYTCRLKPMRSDNGYIVEEAIPTPTISARLVFRTGNKDSLISSYGEKIVIANPRLKLEEGEEYSCELILSPQGKAYIVQAAAAAGACTAQAHAEFAPVFCVTVKINGTPDDSFRFDAITDFDKRIDEVLDKLEGMKITDKDNVLQLYEDLCVKVSNAFKEQQYARNRNTL